MKNILLLSILIFLFAGLFAQDMKGVIPVANSQSTGQKPVTRAVVVGISDYQSSDIPDLNFADRDAEMFAEWLKSPSGGNVPPENITLLTNGQATLGRAAAALDGLIDDCLEGDLAVIYFSGHGDVERKTISQPGYLLCSDSPPQTYMSGGAINLRDMQEIISTLSVQNKARIVVITDACHAGKLAGSEIGGPAATTLALTQRFANEVKILSCQPDESSVEGIQWGGGRGVFSFHLLDGMTGLSDKNGDGVVTLFEIRRYLEDMVPAETLPEAQTPMCIGDLQFPLAQVDAPSLAYLREAKSETPSELGMVENRRIRDVFLAGSDSLTQARYRAFEEALGKKMLLDPPGICANDLYLQLIQDEQIRPLHNLMRRNLAAALQDEVQQALNALLENDPYESNNWAYNPAKYNQYPAYLQRSIELLGENHYMYRPLMSKKRFFEGYNIAKTLAAYEHQLGRRDSLREEAKRLYLEGIAFDPEAPYLYHAIGDLYFGIETYQTDSVVLWCSQAAELSPKWVTPLLRISEEYACMQTDFTQADLWLSRALKILPDSYLIQEKLGYLRFYEGRRDDVFAVTQKMIEERPELFNAYPILVLSYFFMDGDYPAVEEYALKSTELNPSPENWALNFWAGCYAYLHPGPEGVEWIKNSMDASSGIQRGYRGAFLVEALTLAGRYEEAEKYGRQLLAEQLAPLCQTNILYQFGKLRLRQGRLEEAEVYFRQSLAADPTPNALFVADYAWLGEVARLQNRNAEAEDWFKKAFTYESNFGEQMAHLELTWFLYGNYLFRQNHLKEAAKAFQQALDQRRKGFWGEYGFALLAARKGRQAEALDWLERALDNYYPDSASILEEPLFKKIRKTGRFQAMMEKHFPEGWDSQ